MHFKRCMLAILVAVVPSLGHAQNTGVAVHVGTMGVGADFAVLLNPNVSLRAGANYIPFDLNIESSGIDFGFSFPTPQFLGLIDLSPGGAFRLSAGAMFAPNDFELTAPVDVSIDIGNGTYTPSEITSLTGVIATNDVAPYVGIGIGNPARSKIGFFLDLGVAFHGTPAVRLVASGPLVSDLGFQQDLAIEQNDVEADLDWFKIYPVLSLGVSFGLGR